MRVDWLKAPELQVPGHSLGLGFRILGFRVSRGATDCSKSNEAVEG